jgi:RND family efflux transporter MFP subunit
MSRRLTGLLALPLLGSLGLAACHGKPEARPPAERKSGPARDVTVSEVMRSDGEHEVTVPATVFARQRAELSARIPAAVAEIPFDEGQRVKQGEVLVRLDDAALRSAVTAAEAALKTAETDLHRMRSLLEKGAATSREVDQVEAQTAGMRAQLEGARDSLSYAVLRAPFDGRIADRPVDVGDVVSPGRTLITLEADRGFEVRGNLDSAQVGRLRIGQEVEVQVDGQPQPLPATVRSISPAGDPSTHRFEVRADLPGASGVRSGLFARLTLHDPTGAARITVPEAAVFERGGLKGVFVVADGVARLRWVATGETKEGVTEVRAGVSAGERVVVEPSGLEDGAPVAESR